MNFFAANDKIIAICGRHNIHVYPLSFTPVIGMLPLELMRNLPRKSKATPEKLAAVCCDISQNGKSVVAADSGKNVFVFEYIGNTWELFSSWEMEKRVVKVQFDRKGDFVIMTDKTGDIYYSFMSISTIDKPRKAMGHTSFILDVILTEDNSRIVTCDRDEKIRISKFPSSHEILDYKLGHKESVINIALVNFDNHLISVSAEGTLKLWHINQSRAMQSWNVFHILKVERQHEAEVTRMRATDFSGKIYVTVLISGFKELPVFEINLLDKSIRQFGQLKIETDFIDMTWVRNQLYVFNPETASVKKYTVSDNGLVSEIDFTIPAVQSAKLDWKYFAEYNKPFFPLKKRVPSDILATVSNARKLVLAQFGPLSEDEPETQKVLKLAKTVEEEAKFHERLVEMSKEPISTSGRRASTIHHPVTSSVAAHALDRPAQAHGYNLLGPAAAPPGPSNEVKAQERNRSNLYALQNTEDQVSKSSKEIDPLEEKLIAMEEGRSLEMFTYKAPPPLKPEADLQELMKPRRPSEGSDPKDSLQK